MTTNFTRPPHDRSKPRGLLTLRELVDRLHAEGKHRRANLLEKTLDNIARDLDDYHGDEDGRGEEWKP